MKRLIKMVESEDEMKGVDKHVLLDGNLYLVIRYHIITTKHVIYSALERTKHGSAGVYTGEKSGVEFSSIMMEHGATYGRIGSGTPEKDVWDKIPVGPARFKKIDTLRHQEYERAHKLIKRAFPEAAKGKEDDGDIEIFMAGRAADIFPDLKEGLNMQRLSHLLEAFTYTGDWEKDFTDEHPLLPDVIADTVAADFASGSGAATLSSSLIKKFADVYKANKSWAEKILNGRGNTGRDLLYAFMKHWAVAKTTAASPASLRNRFPGSDDIGR